MTGCSSHLLLTTAFVMTTYFLRGGATSDFEDCQANILSVIIAKSTHSNDVILKIFHRALLGKLDLVHGLQYSVTVSSSKYASASSFYLIVHHGKVPTSTISGPTTDEGVFPPNLDDVIECSYFARSPSIDQQLAWTARTSSAPSSCLSLTTVLQSSLGVFIHATPVTLCPPPENRHYSTSEWGWITSPGYPLRYPDNADWIFTIIGPTESSIDLQFQVIRLEPAYSGECVDCIRVSSDNFSSSPICGVFQNEDIGQQRFVVDSDVMWITFSSDTKIGDAGFSAFYAIRNPEAECSFYLQNKSGEITSPLYSFNYLPNTMCTYSIRLPSSYRLIFTIIDLDLGNQTADRTTPTSNKVSSNNMICSNDSIFIKDVNSNTSTVLQCNQMFLSEQIVFESSSSSVDILFSSDHFLEGKGFKMLYKGVPSCKNESLSNSSGTIVSPNYPNNYPNDQKCFYNISAVQSNDPKSDVFLELKFHFLDTESEGSIDRPMRDELCVKDYILIKSEGVTHRVCGNWSGNEHIITFGHLAPLVTVTFISDDQNTRSGFSLSWRTVNDATSGQKCHPKSITTTDQRRFDIFYTLHTWSDGETDCRSRGGHLAKIGDTLTQEMLEAGIIADNGSNCLKKDSFWIGANDRQWESDFYWTSGGKVRYTNWFPGWTHLQATHHQPSDDGLSNEDCVELRRQFPLPWKGSRDAGGYFWNDRNCMEDNPYICEKVPNGTIFVTPPLCNINITMEISKGGEDVSKNSVDRNISSNSNDSTTQVSTISSPSYPQHYTNFLDCMITITSPIGTSIMLEFDSFHLEDPNEAGNCEYDIFSVGSHLNLANMEVVKPLQLCGDWKGREKLMHQIIGQNTVSLTFTTDHSRSFQGFQAKATILDVTHLCGSDKWVYTSGSCFYVSSLKVKNYEDAHSDCESQGSVLWWNTNNIEERKDICQYMQATCGNSCMSGKGYIIWDPKRSNSTNGECYTVTLTKSQRKNGDPTKALDVINQQGNVSCLDTYHYVCSKPSLPYGKYPVSKNISYSTQESLALTVDVFNFTTYPDLASFWIHIVAPSNHRILVSFTNVDIENQTDCLYDYVEVDGVSKNKRICGNLSAKEVVYAISHKNTTTVHFHSDYSINAKGFDVAWSWVDLSGCHQEFDINDTSQIDFSTMNFPHPYPVFMNCSITFRSSNKLTTILVVFDIIEPIDFLDGVEISYDEKAQNVLTLNASFYSKSLGPVLVSDSGYLKLEYKKPLGIGYGEGFQAIARAESDPVILRESCTELHQGEINNIYSIGYPNQSPTRILQDIIIRAPIGYNIEVGVAIDENFSKTLGCSQFLNFHDVSVGIATSESLNFQTKLISKWCELDVNETIRSHLNRLVLRINYGNANDEGFKFILTASVVKDESYLEKTRQLNDHRFDSCRNTPCLNKGVCVTEGNNWSFCHCPPRYGGMFCQELWCDLDPCVHGKCEMSFNGYNCSCMNDFFGVHCHLDQWTCNAQLCNGRGKCLPGNQTYPDCKCNSGWTGGMCAERVNEGEDSITLGQRLLKEPIWIGLIVILSVLLMFGVCYIIRRKCGKHFQCCDTKKPRVEDNILNADGTIALNSFPLRKMNREPCVSPSSRVSMSSPVPVDHHMIVIKTDTDSDGDALTPTPSSRNEKAAARFFASYKDADKNPVATPLTTDFTRTTDTSLSQEAGDASVGAMVGGRLLFDLHIREKKAKEESGMERTTSLLYPTNRHKDRMKRSHSSGPYLMRQETHFDEFSVSGSPNLQNFASKSQHIYPNVIIRDENGGSSVNHQRTDTADTLHQRQSPLTDHEMQYRLLDRSVTDQSGARVIEVNLDRESGGPGSSSNGLANSSPDASSVHTLPATISLPQRLPSSTKHRSYPSIDYETTMVAKERDKLVKYRRFVKEWKQRSKSGSYNLASSSMSLNDNLSNERDVYSLDSNYITRTSRYLKRRNWDLNYPLRRTHTVDDVGPRYPPTDVRKKRERYSRHYNDSSQSLDNQELSTRHHYRRHFHKSRKHESYHSSWELPDRLARSIEDEYKYHVDPIQEWKYIYDKERVKEWERLTNESTTSLPSRNDIHRSSRRSVQSWHKPRDVKLRSRHSSSKSPRDQRLRRDYSSESDFAASSANRHQAHSNSRLPELRINSISHEVNSTSKSKVRTQVSDVAQKQNIPTVNLPHFASVNGDVFSSIFSQEVEIDDFSPIEDDSNIDISTLTSNSNTKTALYSSIPNMCMHSTSTSVSSNHLSVNGITDPNPQVHTDSEVDYKSGIVLIDNNTRGNYNNNTKPLTTNSPQNDEMDQVSPTRSSDTPSTPSACKVIVYDSHENTSETRRPAIVNIRHFLSRKHSSLDLINPHSHGLETNNSSNLRPAASLQDLSSTGKEQQIVIQLPSSQSNRRRGSITNMPASPSPDTPKRLHDDSSNNNNTNVQPHSRLVLNESGNNESKNTSIERMNIPGTSSQFPTVSPPRHQDDRQDFSAYYLSVTDTDSAMSSAPSHNSTPTDSKRTYMDNNYDKKSTVRDNIMKMKDSAYETKQSSLEAGVYLESKGMKPKTSMRGEDKRVTHRLHQAALKLFIMQQRVRRARQHLSKDSAIHTISEDDPTLDDINVTNANSWTLKQGALYPNQPQYEEDFQELSPSQYENVHESHPFYHDRILEEQDCKI